MVKNILTNGKSWLFAKQSSILAAALIMAVTFSLSALLGLIRDRMLAHYYGDSADLGLYFAADRLPSLIFNLLVVGAFSSAFIPVFTRYLKEKERESAWRLAAIVINAGLLIFLGLTVLLVIFSRPISHLLSAGQLGEAEVAKMATMMQIMLVAQLILIVSSFFTGILQSFRYFFLPAITPIFYNLGIISALALFSQRWGIYAPVWGMVVGASLHLLIQLPLAKYLGWRHFWELKFSHPGLKEVWRLLVPRVVSLGITQLPLLFNTYLAFLVSAPAVVVLNFASHLQGLPVGVFGLSMAQATLPALSEESGEKENFKKTFVHSWNQMLFLIMPLAVLLIILRVPVVRLVFGAARYSWGSTLATAYTVAFFTLSAFPQAAVYLLNRAFYAVGDARTPLKVSVYSTLFNLLLAIFLVAGQHWGVWSLALAYSLAAIVSMVWLFGDLARKVGGFAWDELLSPAVRVGSASLLTALALYIPMKILDQLVFDTTRTLNLLALTTIVSVFGLVIYWLCAKMFLVEELAELRQAIFSLRKAEGPASTLPEASV